MAQGLLITGVVLVLFGVVFAVVGRVGERGYWTQRDPQESPGDDDVRLGQVMSRVGEYAMRGKRPSLRLMAIGVILVILGVVAALVGVLASLL